MRRAQNGEVEVIRTARGTADRLSVKEPLALRSVTRAARNSVTVDTRARFQTILGFGGAFTEAAASTFWKLPGRARNEVIQAYFGPSGNGYTLGRTHINSCDFSLGHYSCGDMPGDTDLRSFSIEHDKFALIPMIKEALRAADGTLKLIATPWSPPGWMKTNGKMAGGGKLKADCRRAWARFYGRFIEAYKAEGVRIWGVSVQNEPEASQLWESCLYSAEEERDFVRDHLGPALANHGHRDVKLLIWDHNRDRMVERAKVVLEDDEAARFVWGTAFHWYCGDHFDNVQALHDLFPKKQLLFTEGCCEGGPHVGSWKTGERYAHSIINDLNRWTVGWIDWNLLLDRTGGPNHVGNFCGSPLLANATMRRILYQSSYYAIGHFSRFIRPGAVRVVSASTTDALEVTAFLNIDGAIALVVLNRGKVAVPFALRYAGKSAVTESPAHSITTYRFAE